MEVTTARAIAGSIRDRLSKLEGPGLTAPALFTGVRGEGGFSEVELPLYGVLRSSPWPIPSLFVRSPDRAMRRAEEYR